MFTFLLNLILTSTSIAYPFVWLWQGAESPWLHRITLLLAALWLLRGFNQQDNRRFMSWMLAAILAVVSLSQSMSLMYWYPVLINGLLLVLFGGSLWSKQTVVERLARLQEPDLPEYGVRYTRRVTQVWCVFFSFNIAVCSAFIFTQQYDYWAYYSGVISYFLMGALMLVEFCIRHYVKQRYGNKPDESSTSN